MQRRDAIKRMAWGSAGALSIPALSSIMSGCQVETGPEWIPEFLSPEQADLVAEIAETIIPATDTPGAKDALVHRYIDIMLKDIADEKMQQGFMEGLTAFEQDCQERFSAAFTQLSAEQKSEALTAAQDKPKEADPQRPPFFAIMKQLTLAGYFTSEVGATQALKYVAVPGSYDGCVDLEPGQTAWAI